MSVREELRPGLYNALPSVEQADYAIRSKNLEQLMGEVIGPLMLNHEMFDHWGIGLLHHHWSIEEGEIPGEDYIDSSGDKHYLMRPVSMAAKAYYVPCLLKAEGPLERLTDFLQPLEFSSDKAAVHAYEALLQKPTFMKEIHRALVANGLDSYFGLTSLRREAFGDKYLVEYNGNDRTSIVREEVEEAVDWSSTIQTAWVFSKEAHAMACKKKCFRTCDTAGHKSPHQQLHDPNG